MKKFFTLCLFALATITYSCAQVQEKENSVNIDAQGPIIEFASLSHDYGTIQQGADGNCEFVFENIGTDPLMLTNVRSSCGCTVPNWPRQPVAPGEKATIKVKYDTRRIGPISKSITVYSNGSAQPVILRIKGKVEKPATAAAAQ